jgi:hypothetical protein
MIFVAAKARDVAMRQPSARPTAENNRDLGSTISMTYNTRRLLKPKPAKSTRLKAQGRRLLKTPP